MSEWISVDERLPKPRREGKTVSEFVVAYAGEPVVAFYSTVSGWFDGQNALAGVTHWVPLPPDPKDEA